ncbi:AMP-binding protein [Spiribacter sp. 221]|uniref:class I adenylate-forming enzyme family protein n=1 Tax=Spiribacter onubensis TaxID=3122420 RepID=UPI00349F6F68
MGQVDTDIDKAVVLHPAILLEFPLTMNTEYCADQRPMNWVGDWAGRRRCLTPDRTALVDPESGLQLTYRELDDRARRWATWMVDSLGLGQGDVVALLSRNRLEAIEIFMAAGKTGIVIAPVSHRLSPTEADDILSRLQPALLLSESALGDYIEGLGKAVAILPRLEFGTADSPVEQALARVTPRPVNHALALADTCLLIHTGGSTGLPKICRISHRQMVWNAVELLVAAPEGLAGRRELVLFPLFHVGGWNTVLPILYAGGCAVVPSAFDPASVLQTIDIHRINHLGAVEAMLRVIAEDPAFPEASLASLEAITTAGAPCAETSMAPFLARGIIIRQSYGLTEAGPSNFINARAMDDPTSAVTERASVGTSFFHCDYRIVDPVDGSPVAIGDSGELQLRSPHDFDGYLDDPERSRARWTDDGWIRSGDLAREDSEGRVFIVGRIDNVIVSGGENIAAEEVERLLGEHPAIKGVMVFGVPDERWGERPVAWVTGPAHDALPAIREWLDDRLARFKHPATLQIVEALPVTGAGKPDRRRAREEHIEATWKEGS